jgi:glycerate kinase
LTSIDFPFRTSEFAPLKLRVLIAPDKFKGTLTAYQAAEAIRRGWSRARPEDLLELLPMSDGGDGFGEVIGNLLRADVQRVRTVDAAGRPCTARWWWQPKTKTAIIESAAVIGLALVPPEEVHPFELNTFGLGALLENVAARKPRRCLLGIGGSATNDGGFGVARALGWRFLDRTGQCLQQWTELDRLSSLEPPRSRLRLGELLVAVDVRNPLLGPRGASRVYGPQKGLRSKDLPLAERCLKRLAKVVHDELGRDLVRIPGAGAAGGLGFGLATFLGARLIPGFDLFAKLSHLDKRLRSRDLVVTGEGAIDRSTRMGKGVSQIAEHCRSIHTPCVALGGIVCAKSHDLEIFTRTHALTALTTLENAKAEPVFWLERLAARVASSWADANVSRR